MAMNARLLAVVALPLLAAGCGSSGGTPQVASLTTGSSTTTSTKPIVPRGGSFVRFVTCMQQHGVQAQLGPGGRGVSISGSPNGPSIDGAQTACKKYLPGGGPPALTPAQVAERAKAMLAFAKCMRKHGVPNFPDPNGQGEFNLSSLGLIKAAPALHGAGSACQHLEQNVKGPRIGFG
jgi:hypothetical protein